MVFQQAIETLIELGFYKFFLPFILISAIVYAVLRKSQLFGESPIISGIISMSIAFFVFGLPVLGGLSLVKPLTSFFGQITVVILIISFGLLMTGLFVPDLMGKLGEWATGGGIVWWMIVIVLLIAVSSGLFYFISSPMSVSLGSGGKLFFVFLILILFIILITSVAGGNK